MAFCTAAVLVENEKLREEVGRLKAELTDAVKYLRMASDAADARKDAEDRERALRKRVAELEGQVTEADEALQSRDADMADLERDYAIQRRQLQRTKPETEGE